MNITLKKHLVCHLDLLGAKSKLRSENALEYINLINETYKTVLEIISNANLTVGDFNKTNKCEIKVKIFSDNMLIAMEYGNNENEKYEDTILSMFFAAVGLFQYHFLLKGELLRGGITFDDLHFDERFAIGKGLVTADYLEKNSAIYPRVIIDNSIIINGKLWNNIQSLITKMGFIVNFKKDRDTFYYIDYLNFLGLTECTSEYAKKTLSEIKKTLLEKFNDGQNDLKILNKRNWFKSYFNDFCDINYCPDLKFE